MEPDSEPWPWLIIGLALVLVVLATAIEIVFTTVNRGDIRKFSERGDQRTQIADKLFGELSRLSTTVLLLKSAGLIAVGAVSVQILLKTPGVQRFDMVFLAWLGLVIAQVVSRALVSRHGPTMALQLALLTWGLMLLCWPLTSLLRSVSAWVGAQYPAKDSTDILLNNEDLHQLITTSEEENPLEENEKQMIVSILELEETVIREVMVPRIDMITLDVETSLREALDVIINAGHSRIPVYKEHVDHIVGILYAKDLLKCFHDQRTDAPISALLRPAYFVPVSKKVNTLLKEMQKQRVHIAVVVDEYGGTAGLVTIEDLIEEIIGEIQDEYDNEEDVFVESIGTNVYILNSRLDLYSLSKLLDIELPEEDADTLGGLIYSLLGHVPEQGEATECAGWRFTVLSLDGQRIDQVRAELVAAMSDKPANVGSITERSTVQQALDGNSLYDFQSSD